MRPLIFYLDKRLLIPHSEFLWVEIFCDSSWDPTVGESDPGSKISMMMIQCREIAHSVLVLLVSCLGGEDPNFIPLPIRGEIGFSVGRHLTVSCWTADLFTEKVCCC